MAIVDLANVQGNILRGYRLGTVRHLLASVADPRAAREFIGAVVSGDAKHVPQLTTADHWSDKPRSTLNLGITATGMTALGVSEPTLATFPEEYRHGAGARAVKVGDIGESSPNNWQHGFGDTARVHLMWSIHASDSDAREEATSALVSLWKQWGAFTEISQIDGAALAEGKVHFGYRDSISQPRFEVNGDVIGRRDAQPVAPVGSVLLGYDSTLPGVRWQMPNPRVLGVHGTFNAFRMLEQDVVAFEHFLADVVAAHPELDTPALGVEYVAAKLMGRWRNGMPLVLAPLEPRIALPPDVAQANQAELDRAVDERINNFDYVTPFYNAYEDDYSGAVCPVGAHIRRSNPRGARVVQRSSNYTRRIVRRGIPYGTAYDPAKPADGERRGLLGNFMCASLITQYESIMYDWVNKGMHDPRITGTNDPIIGANEPMSSKFEFFGPDGKRYLIRGFGRFTTTVGSAYLFMPSVAALRYLATGRE